MMPLLRGLFLLLALSLTGCAVSAESVLSGEARSIPAQSDWTDYGLIFEGGAMGQWNYQLWSAFTGMAWEERIFIPANLLPVVAVPLAMRRLHSQPFLRLR